jgi:hypothetical protein
LDADYHRDVEVIQQKTAEDFARLLRRLSDV